jgi:hypothetical protein
LGVLCRVIGLAGGIQMSRRLLSIVLLTFALVALAPPAHSRAAADTFTISQSFPIDLYVYVPCAAGGAGETIYVSGSLHDLLSVTLDASGGYRVKVLDNPQGMSGSGLTTGDKYRATGMTTSMSSGKVGATSTYVNRFIMIGQNTGNNLLVRETSHYTVNANGELTASFDNLSVDCK